MPGSDDPFATDFSRPRPRAGGRGPADRDPQRERTVPVRPAEAVPGAAPPFRGVGLSPLVRSAGPLLLLAGHLRGTVAGPDIAGLRRHVLEEIHRFEERARAEGIQNEIVLVARYAICTSIDEAVLSTPWGAQSDWAQQPLLVTLHREAWGGEKFFEMLDRISRDPGRYLDLIELQYLCVALGLSGKYRVAERGDVRLVDLQRDVYRMIRDRRGAWAPELSANWRGVEVQRSPFARYVPWWVVGAGALAILSMTFVFYHARLDGPTTAVEAALADVGVLGFRSAPSPATPSGTSSAASDGRAARPPESAAAPPPPLKQLLADDVARGTLTLEEQGGRTVMTLVGGDLFPSGSAAVNPAYDPLLQRVALALGRLPGRILVVGHTDDAPLRSLRYADNFELSRERAVSVARVLQASLDNPGRLVWRGVGSSEPRYRPESEPENRARNRRVEIIYSVEP